MKKGLFVFSERLRKATICEKQIRVHVNLKIYGGCISCDWNNASPECCLKVAVEKMQQWKRSETGKSWTLQMKEPLNNLSSSFYAWFYLARVANQVIISAMLTWSHSHWINK